MSILKKCVILGIVLLFFAFVACQNISDDTEVDGQITTATTEITTEIITTSAQPNQSETRIPWHETTELHQFFDEHREILQYFKDTFISMDVQSALVSNFTNEMFFRDTDGNRLYFDEEQVRRFNEYVEMAGQKMESMVEISLSREYDRRLITFSFFGMDVMASIVYMPDGIVSVSPAFSNEEVNLTHIEGDWWSWYF